MAFSGCCLSLQPESNFSTQVTLNVDSIKSRGSIIPQSFNKDCVDLLEKKLDGIILATGAKGVSASVGVPDKGIWYAARGDTGNPLKNQITPDLKFCAGSIGKIFTAVVILKLMEEGKLSLESPVSEWFPEISRADVITINHLLTHTSGIAGFDNTEEYESQKYLYRNPEELISYMAEKELLFEPGEHYAYSNTGYIMLGIIIQRVIGGPYREAVERYIINRINLHETDVITPETINDLVVKGHHNGNVISGPEDYAVPFAAGSIASTPRDLIKFLHAVMNGRLLSMESLQILFSDMNLMAVTQSTYYGKGVVAALETPAGDIIGHTGGVKGFGAALFYHPEKNIFVCVMMNDDIKAVDPAVFEFLEAMMAF
jgi:D-alanyl-D-alanine carboxypeptidase